MKSTAWAPRVLGIAFLLQFVTSLFSGAVLRTALIVPGNIGASMLNIANNPWLMRATILVDMLTAFGIVFLGVMLFQSLKKQDESTALVAMGFYGLEAALLAVSRISAFDLLRVSQEYATTVQSASVLLLGRLALESMDFGGSTLHMLSFCLGGILFYYLLFKSGIVPRVLSLWGLIAICPCLIGTLISLFGYEAPIFLYLPYIPFELVIGVWFLVKGVQEKQPAAMARLPDVRKGVA